MFIDKPAKKYLYNGHVLTDTTNIENAIMPPPPEGQWARPGTVDGSIGRFLLPLGGGSAEVNLEATFSYKRACPDGHNEDRKWLYAAPGEG